MSGARGTDKGSCNNCESMVELLRKMGEKMDQMSERFNGVETLMKAENQKLQEKLDRAEKRYETVCSKVDEMAVQINRLKQDNLSRNLLIKGVPELETDPQHLKSMVALVFAKLRYNFPMTYVDCFRIGKPKENTCRPIVVALPNAGLKNMIIRDKRATKLTCANFSNDSSLWGAADKIIYIDEHLTRENHMLYMYTRKLKEHDFKYIWTRNGRIFVRFDSKSNIISINSTNQVNKLIVEVKLAKKRDEEETEMQTDRESDEQEIPEQNQDGDKYEDLIDNPPLGRRNKRKKDSPPGQGKNHGRSAKSRK